MSDSLRGNFLIAARHLRDGNFFKAVVLMLEHNAGGAMGVVVNRPMDITVSAALAKHFDIPESPHCLYCGGPVEPNALLIVHNSPEHDQEHLAIVPDLFVGTSPDIFDRVADAIRNPDDGFRFRIFAGYSGWGAGQLEQEIGRGDWHALPADAEHVLKDDPYNVWDDVLQAFYEQNRIFPNQPDRPEWN